MASRVAKKKSKKDESSKFYSRNDRASSIKSRVSFFNLIIFTNPNLGLAQLPEGLQRKLKNEKSSKDNVRNDGPVKFKSRQSNLVTN